VYVTQQDVNEVYCVGYKVIANITDKVDEILVLHTHTTNQQMHIYKYFELCIIVFHQNISVTLVAIIVVSYKPNTINVQLIYN
jgi:hypothetical protein